MLDLNDIALFIQVVRAGSFREAARRLGLPPNTVSRRVAALEVRLRSRLFQRTTRKLSLTAVGQRLFERCDASVDTLDQAIGELLASDETPQGRLRVTAPVDFVPAFGIERLQAFLQKYPSVQLELLLDDAPVDMIAEGIDVALRSGRMPDSSLVARRLSDNHAVLVASSAYLSKYGAPESVAALSSHRCLSYTMRSERTTWSLEGPDGSVSVDVSGPFRANNIVALMAAAHAGIGIALLPMPRVAEALRAGGLVRLLPEFRRDLGGFYAVLPSRQQPTAAVSAFIDCVTQAMNVGTSSVG